ncbi:uncharacterized protein AKAME5_001564200, partial [Lates japonicus]
MVLFIVSKLLLTTLLFQPTEENREWKTHTTRKPDNSERFGEFCLRISDDSQWTSSKPPPQICEWCNLEINVEDVDPKAVQSLNVKMQPFLCPVLI